MASKVAATVHIRRPSEMTAEGRRAIAEWLRNTADDLEGLGDRYDDNFRARYWYADDQEQ